jgi:hypothetical protein
MEDGKGFIIHTPGVRILRQPIFVSAGRYAHIAARCCSAYSAFIITYLYRSIQRNFIQKLQCFTLIGVFARNNDKVSARQISTAANSQPIQIHACYDQGEV